MTITELFRSVKRRAGLFDLPLDGNITEQTLIEVIEEETIPTFSIYVPYIVTLPYNIRANQVSGHDDYYFLDSRRLGLGSMRIISIEDMEYNDRVESDFVYGSMIFGSGLNVMDYIDVLLQAQMANIGRVPITWEYEAPDKVYIPRSLTGIPDVVTAKLGIRHQKNLSTLDETYRENIIQLATYDIQWFLYENLYKRHDNINTTFDTIQLKLENFERAEDKRTDLLQKWEERYINQKRRKMYIA